MKNGKLEAPEQSSGDGDWLESGQTQPGSYQEGIRRDLMMWYRKDGWLEEKTELRVGTSKEPFEQLAKSSCMLDSPSAQASPQISWSTEGGAGICTFKKSIPGDSDDGEGWEHLL